MAKLKQYTKRDEIRIMKPSPKMFAIVKRLAKKENRTVPKQAEYMLIQYIEQNGL